MKIFNEKNSSRKRFIVVYKFSFFFFSFTTKAAFVKQNCKDDDCDAGDDVNDTDVGDAVVVVVAVAVVVAAVAAVDADVVVAAATATVAAATVAAPAAVVIA